MDLELHNKLDDQTIVNGNYYYRYISFNSNVLLANGMRYTKIVDILLQLVFL